MLAGEKMVADRQLQIPIDPFAIATAERIEVIAKPCPGGVSGMLLRVGNDYGIAYSAHLANEGFERFSVAHELGHFFLDGHFEHVLNADGIHKSRAGFTSKDRHEVEADQFAVGLLLPTKQFKMLIRSAEDGLGAIERMAATARTSLTATAIRYAECCREAIAIALCGQEEVEFCVMSSAFRDLKGLNWLRSGEPIPRRTATYAFVGDPSRIVDRDRADESTHIHEWFGGGPDLQLREEVVGLGRYGKALTVLTPCGAIDEEEIEEENALISSWTPSFSKARRR